MASNDLEATKECIQIGDDPNTIDHGPLKMHRGSVISSVIRARTDGAVCNPYRYSRLVGEGECQFGDFSCQFRLAVRFLVLFASVVCLDGLYLEMTS